MGGSSSAELLRVALRAQPQPLHWSYRSIITAAPTTLRINIPTWRSTEQVFNHDTNQMLYEITYGSLSSRVTLQTPDGEAVLSVKSQAFSDYYRVYEGAEAYQERYKIHFKFPVFSPDVVFTEFEDKISKSTCRALVEGSVSDKVSLVYLERGWPKLSELNRLGDGECPPQYQEIVGSIGKSPDVKSLSK